MDNQQLNLLSDSYKNYRNNCKPEYGNEPDWMRPEIDFQYLTQEEFINKIKTNPEFAEKWGVTIKERELTYNERNELFNKNYESLDKDGLDQLSAMLETDNTTPTKLISITYNNKTIENYE